MPEGSSRRNPVAVDIRVASDGWRKALPNVAAALRRAARAALKDEIAPRETGLSILLTDDAEMRKLNAGWRAKDRPTNVLSFPAEAAVDPRNPPDYLGDIALGLATCRREAAEQGKSLADHVVHLTVHGVLHLIGYDHMNEEEANAMEPREVAILAGLGIADPYAAPGPARAKKLAVTAAGPKRAAAVRRKRAATAVRRKRAA